MDRKSTATYGALTGAMIIVGSSIVVGKLVIVAFPPFLALSIRFAIGLPLLLGLTWRRGEFRRLKRSQLISIFLQALMGVFGFNVLLLFGLRSLSATDSGLITSTTPAAIAVLALLILRERLAAQEWLGVLFSVTGIMVVSLASHGGKIEP